MAAKRNSGVNCALQAFADGGLYLANYKSPIGGIRLGATDDGLCQLNFFEGGAENAGITHPNLTKAVQWLDAFFAHQALPEDHLMLALSGTDFQIRVWQELLDIPRGEVAAYGDIAKKLNSSPRAVGNAVGRNPICILVPCHRVVGAGGSLGGYGGGLERKLWLLEHEGAAANLRRPQKRGHK